MVSKGQASFARGEAKVPALQRFLLLVEKEASGCWIWQGTLNQKGLARFNLDGKKYSAATWYWKQLNGEVPEGESLYRFKTCEGMSCVNPHHLQLSSARLSHVKTHCKNGHDMSTAASRRQTAEGSRCLTCDRDTTRHYNHVRRIAEKTLEADRIDDFLVFERDGWVCQICLSAVDPELDRRHKMGATIDHRKPLSRGGTHTYDNVQLAHFSCNSKKWAHTQEKVPA